MKYYASFDIGGTAIKGALLSQNAEIIEKYEMPTEAEKGPEVWMKKIVRKVEEMKTKCSLSGLCISSTAMIDSDNGSVFFSLPQVPHYTGFEVKKYLEKETFLPVEVENDVNCASLAESISGAGKGRTSVLTLAVGTGIGGGFCVDGKLLRGHTFSFCEVGYIKVKDGDLEHMGSTSALARRVERMKGLPAFSYDGLKVVKEAINGDEDCKKALSIMVDSIADGLVTLSYILNPEIIVLGGGIMKNATLVDEIRDKYKSSINPLIGDNTTIVKAYYDNDAGLIGAYYHFLEKRGGER